MKTFLLCDKFLSFEHNVSGIGNSDSADFIKKVKPRGQNQALNTAKHWLNFETLEAKDN